jgi:hypothetical protein
MGWRRQLCSRRDRDERDRAFPQRETPLEGAGFLIETTEGSRELGRAVYSPPECSFSRKGAGLGSSLLGRMDHPRTLPQLYLGGGPQRH